MKNAGAMKINVLAFFSLLAGIFVSSCGMEEVLIINEPSVTYSNPLYSSSDPLTWYFNFAPASDTGDSFLGTDIYYKIYNNHSVLSSHRSAILSVNDDSNASAAATRMIEGYSYQQLGKSVSNGEVVFVPAESGFGRVVLRLKDYMDGLGADPSPEDRKTRYNFEACVGRLNGTEYAYENYIPVRYNGKSFDFFDYHETHSGDNVEPASGDSDYYPSGSSSESDCYYVQLFAVGVAMNSETVSNSYSLVLDLGSVPIRKGQ